MIAAELESQGIFARFLQVGHPFHHEMMQPAADALKAALADFSPQAETVPFFSTVTGQRLAGSLAMLVTGRAACGSRCSLLQQSRR